MAKKITLDYSFTFPFVDDQKIEGIKAETVKAFETLKNGTGKGNDFIGWRNLPADMLESDEFKEILKVGDEIYNNADLIICVGIGGSYLGSKAVTEALLHPFYNMLPKSERKGPKMLFAGHNISGSYLEAILSQINTEKSVYVNVISTSLFIFVICKYSN